MSWGIGLQLTAPCFGPPAGVLAHLGERSAMHRGCSENYGPVLVIDYITAPNMLGYQNRILILGTTHIWSCALRSQPPPPPPPNGIPPPHPPMKCYFKSADSHRDQPRQGRHPRNCRRFWSRKASILVTVVTFGPSCCRRASKVPTVTGIGVVLIAILRTVLTFDPSCCRRRASDVSTGYKCIIFPPSELSSLLAPYVFCRASSQMYRQSNNHRYKPSIEP